jgi:hypothetical protein
VIEAGDEKEDANCRGNGEKQAEIDAVQQPAAALVEAPGAERLRAGFGVD